MSDDATFATLLAEAERDLASYAGGAGRVTFPMAALIVAAMKPDP